MLTYQLFSFGITTVQANLNVISASNGGKIDLFTQKEPYSGRGINKFSDAFAPGSVVFLYALVTYNEEPLDNWPVSFEIIPPNTVDGIAPIRHSSTNASGIAMTDFTLQGPGGHPETLFGIWYVNATTSIPRQEVVADILTFRVGWIVEIVSLTTIDENLKPKSHFAKATCVGAEMHVRNIAMLPKTATIVVNAYDAHNESFDSVILNDFNVEPGETYIFAHCFLNISEQAATGNAILNASAYTAPPSMGGVSYSPEVSAKFVITSRDVAVINVVTSSIEVIAGQIVNVTVTVKNKGDEDETFSVNAYYGDSLIQAPISIASLPPNQNRTITFVWNTTYVPAGIYEIKAVAEILRGETEAGDNTRSDGTVMVRVPRVFMLPRELSIVVLIVAAALAFFAIMLLLTRKKESSPQPVMLNVDVLPSEG
jgi:hypothetical protein